RPTPGCPPNSGREPPVREGWWPPPMRRRNPAAGGARPLPQSRSGAGQSGHGRWSWGGLVVTRRTPSRLAWGLFAVGLAIFAVAAWLSLAAGDASAVAPFLP